MPMLWSLGLMQAMDIVFRLRAGTTRPLYDACYSQLGACRSL